MAASIDDRQREEARRALLGLPPEDETPEPLPETPTVELVPEIPDQTPDEVASKNIAVGPEEERLRQGGYNIVEPVRAKQLEPALPQVPPTPEPAPPVEEIAKSVSAAESAQKETEAPQEVITETPKEIVPEPTDIPDTFFKQASVAPKNPSDTYREKLSLSDYEAKKHLSIEMQGGAEEPVHTTRTVAEELITTLKRDDKNTSEKVTLAHLAATALDKRAKEKEEEARKALQRTRRRRMSVVILLVVAIALCVFAIARTYLTKETPGTLAEEILGATQDIRIDQATPEQIINDARLLDTPQTLVLWKETEEGRTIATLPDTLTTLRMQIPRTLSQALTGRYAFGGAEGKPFLILEISSFEYAFAGMIEWESRLPNDVRTLFPVIDPSLSSFDDLTLSNIDMRTLTAEDGEGSLSYAILNNDYILIAETPDSLITIAPHALTLVESNRLAEEQ